jgi:L-gulonate 5-dehydrogenase
MECPALLVEQDLSMRVGTRRLSAPAGDEALVKVEWAGLCGSDLHVMRTGDWVTDWPATLGHEIYGRIELAPAGSGLVEGSAVVADSRIPCGSCPICATDPNGCPRIRFVGEARPGGFATHCVLPIALLHEVPETVDGATAVLAEPLAVALHALSHLTGAPRRAAILGHGPIGALIHIELRRRWSGVEVDVAEPAVLRASLARALGAETVAGAEQLVPTSYDTVIDAAGYAGSLPDAIALCAPEADLLIVALGEREVRVRPMEIVERRLRVVGSNAFRDELLQAIELLADQGWRYDGLVTDAVALDELPAAATRQLTAPDAVKLLVRP